MGRWAHGGAALRHQLASVHELAQLGLFASLPGETLGKLAERMDRRELSPGESPADADDGSRFYAVLTGVLSAPAAASGVLRPGDFFGEVALPDSPPAAKAVSAMTPATVATCDELTFDEFIRPLLSG